MTTKDQYKEGIAAERVHLETYQWLLELVARGRFPKPEEFLAHLVNDRIKQDPNFYQKLSTLELGKHPNFLGRVSGLPQ